MRRFETTRLILQLRFAKSFRHPLFALNLPSRLLAAADAPLGMVNSESLPLLLRVPATLPTCVTGVKVAYFPSFLGTPYAIVVLQDKYTACESPLQLLHTPDA
jgi:hypothetical protein